MCCFLKSVLIDGFHWAESVLLQQQGNVLYILRGPAECLVKLHLVTGDILVNWVHTGIPVA